MPSVQFVDVGHSVGMWDMVWARLSLRGGCEVGSTWGRKSQGMPGICVVGIGVFRE